MTSRVFLLTPSRGLGGGIERYAETLEWAFAALGLVCQRVDLQHAGMGAHAGMVVRMLRHGDTPARLVLVHRSLLPAVCLLAGREPSARSQWYATVERFGEAAAARDSTWNTA
jgi:hypothetical protein